jgi:hypothetical protein
MKLSRCLKFKFSRQIGIFTLFQEEELKSSILVVLANKQDIEGAMSVTEVSLEN